MSLSKPRPILKDMPYHIKKMIVESIPSFLDRLPLRKTSKEFIGIVDTANVETTFRMEDKTVWINWSHRKRLLKKHATNKGVADHFKCFVLKPNVTFSLITIVENRALSVELLKMLTVTVHRQLRVKDFRMYKGGQARILEFMEPGTLKRIFLNQLDQGEAETIFRMEQWKQARRVHLEDLSAACEVWWNFPRFHIGSNPSMNLTDLPRVLEHVSNSATFVSGNIFHHHWTINAIVEALGGGDWEWKQDGARQFAEKAFPVGNRGSKIIVRAFKFVVEFTMKRSDE